MSAASVVATGLENSSGSGRIEIEKGKDYYAANGIAVRRGLSDGLLAQLYVHWIQDGTLERVYYQFELPTLYGFLTEFLRADTTTIGFFRENQTTLNWEIFGMCWINEMVKMGKNHTRATVSEAFIRKTKPADAIAAANLAIEMGFDFLSLDTLVGATPIPNRVACIFPKKLGFEVCSPIPGWAVWKGELCSIQISSMTRERWKQIRPFKD